MNGHLSGERWAAAVLSKQEGSSANHAAECTGCRDELSAASAALDAYRAHVREVIELPESFWRRQREAIHARAQRHDFSHPWRRWIWATATIMLVLCASMILSHKSAPLVQSAAQTVSDDELLLGVQRSIQSDLPQALRPAALLTQEMGRAEAARRTP